MIRQALRIYRNLRLEDEREQGRLANNKRSQESYERFVVEDRKTRRAGRPRLERDEHGRWVDG